MTNRWPPGRLAWRPRTRADVEWARRLMVQGSLARILPGIYVPAPQRRDLRTRVEALRLLDPDAVVTGAAAAALTWWPELEVAEVAVVRRHAIGPRPGFRFERRSIPLELTRDLQGLRVTTPALTVLDLVPRLGARALDEALRRGACTLADLHRALELTPHRRGNQLRRLLLDDSRDAPWSPAERALHRLLRSLRLGFGFTTNRWVRLASGRMAALDVALDDLRLALEVDGYRYHSDRDAFERDRARDADLAAQGWQVVRLSASMVEHAAQDVGLWIREIVRGRAALLGLPPPR